jgi:hypothetical protein
MFVDFLTEFIHRSSQLCSLFNVEYLLKFEEKVVQFLVGMWRHKACSLIHVEPQTNQIQGSA